MPRKSRTNNRTCIQRVRKTILEKKILEAYFKIDPLWCSKTIKYVQKIVKLSQEKIYKWGYIKILATKQIQRDSFPYLVTLEQVSSEGQIFGNTCDFNLLCDWLCQDYKSKSELSSQEQATYDKIKEEVLNNSESTSEVDGFQYEPLSTPSSALEERSS
mmetsp:Transcript_3354/g.3957  ORF Transcript_3354/g.3957 Transcript_3354/m.3957 type:complete len:159 (+) Transcript_3354:39-515(+)